MHGQTDIHFPGPPQQMLLNPLVEGEGGSHLDTREGQTETQGIQGQHCEANVNSKALLSRFQSSQATCRAFSILLCSK